MYIQFSCKKHPFPTFPPFLPLPLLINYHPLSRSSFPMHGTKRYQNNILKKSAGRLLIIVLNDVSDKTTFSLHWRGLNVKNCERDKITKESFSPRLSSGNWEELARYAASYDIHASWYHAYIIRSKVGRWKRSLDIEVNSVRGLPTGINHKKLEAKQREVYFKRHY